MRRMYKTVSTSDLKEGDTVRLHNSRKRYLVDEWDGQELMLFAKGGFSSVVRLKPGETVLRLQLKGGQS